VIVDTSKGKDVFGPGWNARSRVEEYGGGAAIAYGGVVYFSNFGGSRVYKVDVGKEGEPVAVTSGIFHSLGFAFRFRSPIQFGVDGISSQYAPVFHRERKPQIRGFHRIAHPSSSPHRDSRRPHPPISI